MIAMINEPTQTDPQPREATPQRATSESMPRESWRSEELLGGRAEVLILHNNEVYRLRRTRQGKLILHK